MAENVVDVKHLKQINGINCLNKFESGNHGQTHTQCWAGNVNYISMVYKISGKDKTHSKRFDFSTTSLILPFSINIQWSNFKLLHQTIFEKK